MADKHKAISGIYKICEEIEKIDPDKDNISKIRVDLLDILDCCEWFLNAVANFNDSTDKGGEIENFLVDIDVHLIGHIEYHLPSLRKGVNRLLEQFPIADS